MPDPKPKTPKELLAEYALATEHYRRAELDRAAAAHLAEKFREEHGRAQANANVARLDADQARMRLEDAIKKLEASTAIPEGM